MKKTIAVILLVAMLFSLAVSSLATQTYITEDNGSYDADLGIIDGHTDASGTSLSEGATLGTAVTYVPAAKVGSYKVTVPASLTIDEGTQKSEKGNITATAKLPSSKQLTITVPKSFNLIGYTDTECSAENKVDSATLTSTISINDTLLTEDKVLSLPTSGIDTDVSLTDTTILANAPDDTARLAKMQEVYSSLTKKIKGWKGYITYTVAVSPV